MNKWPFSLLDHAGECVEFLVEELKIATITKRAFITLENARPMLAMVAKILGEKNATPQSLLSIKQLLADSGMNEAIAKQEREREFETIHRHSIISMWSAIETAIEDIVSDVIAYDPDAFSLMEGHGLKLPRDLKKPLDDVETRRLFRNIESSLRKSCSAGPAMIEMLNMLLVKCDVSPDVVTFLDEINAVRNSLVHRGGMVDDRLIRAVPALAPMQGQRFMATEDYHWRVFNNLSLLTSAILAGVNDYIKLKASP